MAKLVAAEKTAGLSLAAERNASRTTRLAESDAALDHGISADTSEEAGRLPSDLFGLCGGLAKFGAELGL